MGNQFMRLVFFCILGLVVIFAALDSYFVLDADTVAVVQYLNGTLELKTSPGPTFCWWGKVTKYPKRDQFWFSAMADQGTPQDQSLPVRFNDNANAMISGSASYEYPINVPAKMIELHTLYGSPQAVAHALVRTVFEKAVYTTGPLMSSKEAAAERRNDLLFYIQDQVVGGAYKTNTVTIQDKDPMTNAPRTRAITQITLNKDGTPAREDESPLTRFLIRTTNLSINKVAFDPTVEAQMQEQQRALQQVQIAIAKAKEAEQAAITAAKNGEAQAATAKWEQEVIKARAVTQAEQQLDVATLEKKAAEQTKQKDILLGEGESIKRRLIFQADGALSLKLNAMIQMNKDQWDAIAKYPGNWVPTIIMGSDGKPNSNHNGAQALIDMLSVKTAQELGLNITAKK